MLKSELLEYAKIGWNNENVVALGSVWQGWGGGREVPVLGLDGDGRSLDLHWFDDDWGGPCRFAGVRNSSLK